MRFLINKPPHNLTTSPTTFCIFSTVKSIDNTYLTGSHPNIKNRGRGKGGKKNSRLIDELKKAFKWWGKGEFGNRLIRRKRRSGGGGSIGAGGGTGMCSNGIKTRERGGRDRACAHITNDHK